MNKSNGVRVTSSRGVRGSGYRRSNSRRRDSGSDSRGRKRRRKRSKYRRSRSNSPYTSRRRKHKHKTRSCSFESDVSRSARRNDDSVGEYKGRRGDMILDYCIIRDMGVGTFGRVVECANVLPYCHPSKKIVAIKVVRNIPKYVAEAEIEADILRRYVKVNRSYEGFDRIVYMYDSFRFRSHYCIVFEPLGMSLYDFQRKTNYKPMVVHDILRIGEDMKRALEFLHQRCSLIHADLKLENILFDIPFPVSDTRKRDFRFPRVKLIDFGGAVHVDYPPDDEDAGQMMKNVQIINTRQYRAPEVTLRAGWSYSSDLWSLGCIMMELLGGDLLFQTHNEHEHIALIQKMIDEIPLSMRSHNPKSEENNEPFFGSSLDLRWPSSCASSSEIENVKKVELLENQISKHFHRARVSEKDPDVVKFKNAVVAMLAVDPKKRTLKYL